MQTLGIRTATVARAAARTAARAGGAARAAHLRSGRSRLDRARERGFTLIELMVVVVLIAILAMIAAPAMRTARDDRLAFDYARQIQQLVARARTRAAGRGGAHLIAAAPSGGRGRVFLFEALDGVAGPTPPGPNPATSCKTLNQWAGVATYDPATSTPSNINRIVEGLDLDSIGVNQDADIKATFLVSDVANPTTMNTTPAFVLCVTANGTVYTAAGPDIATAITNMQASSPFTGVADIRITRNVGGTAVGLSRNVMIAGAGAPRIQSR